MRDIGEGTIRHIDWQELTPVVLLLRIFNIATSLRVLSFCILGVLFTLIGGMLVNSDLMQNRAGKDLFSSPAYLEPLLGLQSEESPDLAPFAQGLTSDPSLACDFSSARTPLSFRNEPGSYCRELTRRSVYVPWDIFTTAGIRSFSFSNYTWTERCVLFVWLIYLLCCWSFFGGLVCRTVALRLTVDESDSLSLLGLFLKKRGSGLLGSVTILLLGILVCLLPIWIAGLLYSVPGLNYLVAVLFPIPLLFGFFAVVLGLGLLVGWPLLFGAVSVDGTDGFDAVSRLFSYVFQRPLHYLLYWTVAGLLGMLGYVFVSIVINGVVDITIHFGGFPNHAAIREFGDLINTNQTGIVGAGSIVLLWCSFLQLFKIAYCFAWFWTSAVAIYLLLRRSVDATPLVEAYRLGPAAEKPQKLPDIVLDEKGAPELATPPGKRGSE